MKLLNTSLIIEMKSKFHGYLYELDNQEEIKLIISDLKNNNKDYRHMPYAFKINNTAGKSDDHEPFNTAGIQIFNTLERNNLNNHLLVIIRFYGGVKLGASLLLRTYRNCANKCIIK